MATSGREKRVGGRVSVEAWEAWTEVHARTGASVSALLEVIGPLILVLLDEGNPAMQDTITKALQLQARRARNQPG